MQLEGELASDEYAQKQECGERVRKAISGSRLGVPGYKFPGDGLLHPSGELMLRTSIQNGVLSELALFLCDAFYFHYIFGSSRFDPLLQASNHAEMPSSEVG